MKVLMKTLACGPGGTLHPRQVYDLPDEQAAALFEGGYADIVAEAVAAEAGGQAAAPVNLESDEPDEHEQLRKKKKAK